MQACISITGQEFGRGRKAWSLSPPSPPLHLVGVRNQCWVRPRTMALSHGLFISAQRFKEFEGFFYRAGSLASVFAREKHVRGENRLAKEMQTALPSFCILFFSSLRGKQDSTASLPWLQSASILLDTLLLENKSEPRKVSNCLIPAASSRD